jgi:hypothetical protein
VEEEVQAAEQVIVRPDLAVFAERGLEVIALHRQVVPIRIGRGLGLHERGELTLRIHAAVVPELSTIHSRTASRFSEDLSRGMVPMERIRRWNVDLKSADVSFSRMLN